MSDGANRMISDRKAAFYASMKNHQIAGAGISWFSMLVTLESSDNRHIAYPVVGVIRFVEQKTDLGVRTAVFHALRDDGSQGTDARRG